MITLVVVITVCQNVLVVAKPKLSVAVQLNLGIKKEKRLVILNYVLNLFQHCFRISSFLFLFNQFRVKLLEGEFNIPKSLYNSGSIFYTI